MVNSKLLIVKGMMILAATLILLQVTRTNTIYWTGNNGAKFLTRADALTGPRVAQAAGLPLFHNDLNLAALNQNQSITPTMQSQMNPSQGTDELGSGISVLTTTISFYTYLPIIFTQNSSPTSPLVKPTLLIPLDSSTETRPTLFDWTDVTNATGYRFQLSTSNSFTSLIVDQSLVASTFTLSSNLIGLYYWRVYAFNNTAISPYSEVRSVQLVDNDPSPSPLGIPILLTPADGSPQALPKFDWTDVVSATAYQFQLSTTNDFTNLDINQTVTTSTFTMTSIVDGLFYWRVYALNDAFLSPYSEVRSVQLVNSTGDADGDSLPNDWELHGYDKGNDGTIEVDLPALGASYLHKDIFVEMDYMERASAANGLAPNQTVMDKIVTVFNDAPVSNPDGVDGIKLHLDLDDLLPYDDSLDPRKTEFKALKKVYFDPKRTAVYHYMIWANVYEGYTSEHPANSGMAFSSPGTDFFVTLGAFNNHNGGTNTQKITAFIHELGHDLGFGHGGNDNHHYKPNYFSVMNYWWDLKGIPHDGGVNYGYQPFTLPTLDEGNLNEPLGLNGGSLVDGYSTFYYCPGGSKQSVSASGRIDWNCDGDTNDTNISVDINHDGSISKLASQNDWAMIEFHGGNVIGRPSQSLSNTSLLGKPTLLTSPDGSAEIPPTLFDWTDVTNATGYQFQLSTTSAFTSLAVDQTVVTSTFTLSSNMTGLYYWRVQAFDDTSTSSYSEVRSVQLVNYNGDADGDSLPNGWELRGYDKDNNGTIEVDLPALGASYRHKDIFVEMDYMQRASATNGLAPSQAVIDRIVAIFANAPVPNPDGTNGIKLHLELDDLLPYDDDLSWNNGKINEFYALKSNYFDSSKRAAVYHYMIWANKYRGETAERPSTTGYSRRAPGADFFVTLGSFNNNAGGTNSQKVSVFTHELGHNLGLYHGGDNARNNKPNYFSIMNYFWDLTGIPYNGNYIIDYQPFSLPTLNETKLNETIGLNGGAILVGYSTSYYCPNGTLRSVPANGPIDWNCDGDTTDRSVKVDINKDGIFNSLSSQNDWSKLIFNGGGVIGP